MKTNKKTIICALLILTIFSIIGTANASDSLNENLTITNNANNANNINDHQNSINEAINTINSKSNDDKENTVKNSKNTSDKLKNDNPKVIYVSKSGNDNNDGSKTKPVANISKAVTLTKTGSGKIIITEGEYFENGITINNDLDISTNGAVTINGNGLRAFDIKSGNIKISNITFTNCNNSYSGAVIRINTASLILDKCNFIKNGGEYRDNLIRVINSNLTIINCLFEYNTAHKNSTNYGGVYISDSVLYVDNTTFKNNYNKYGQLYITGSSTGSSAIIKNSKFIGNNATSSSGGTGAAIYLVGTTAYTYSNGTVRPGAPATVSVENCEFINNSAKGGKYYKGQGGAIYVNNNATLIVTKSQFINNSVEDNINGSLLGQGGAIFSSAGKINIIGTLFKNNIAKNGSEIYMKYYGKDNTTLNRLNVTNSIFNTTSDAKLIESDYTNGTLIANNNDWVGIENITNKISKGIIAENGRIINNNTTPNNTNNTQTNTTNPNTTSNNNDETINQNTPRGNEQTSKATTPKQIITAKNLKVKKTAKKLKIKVTLKKLNNNILKNKKITLKLNGKTYKTKTNKKGTATFKIPKKAIKKLKTGKTYKYTINYGKYKLTKKITIKK